MKECRYTVCRPVQTTCMKTVTETCYQTVTETACREVCETVCVPRTVVQQVTRDCGEWVTEQDLRPGQDDLRERLRRTSARRPTAAGRSGARGPWSRTSAARSTSRRSSASRCPYTICKQVPVCVDQAGPGHDLPDGGRGVRQAGPARPLPDGPRDLRQAGAGDHLRDGAASSASSRCRSRPAGWCRRPATRRSPTPSARCSPGPARGACR